MLATAWSLTSLLLIVLAAEGLGRPLARAWPLISPSGTFTAPPWTQATWRICLGLVAAGCLLTALAFVGLLNANLIRMLTIAAATPGIVRWLTSRTNLLNFLQRRTGRIGEPSDATEFFAPAWDTTVGVQRNAGTVPPRGLILVLLGLLVAASGSSLLVALAPATDGDALCYHLALPKYYLEAGGFRHLPYHDNSTFPLLVEMLFAWGLALDGAVTAQLIHWLFGVLLAGATFLLALDVFVSPSGPDAADPTLHDPPPGAPSLGDSSASGHLIGQPARRCASTAAEGWAMVAATVAVLTPTVTNQMTAAFNDLALAVFTTFALVAWRQATRINGMRGEPLAGGFVAAGIMAGAALSTKYLAFLFAIAVGAAWLLQIAWQRGSRRQLLTGAAVVAVVSAAVAGPWYARAAVLRGNPVYPFLGEVFSTAGPKTDRPEKRPMETRPADIATASWQLTMEPERFGGRAHQLGVLFLAALPGVCLVRRLPRLWLLLAIAAVYIALWYTMRQNLRFLLPVVPLLAVAVAAAWQTAVRFGGLPGWLISGAALASLAFNSAQAMGRAQGEVAVALGWESRETYLQRHVPTYAASVFAAARLPRSARILSQDYRQFHFSCEVTQENVFRRATGYTKAVSRGASLPELLSDAGFTHLLLMKVEGSKVRHSTLLSRLVDGSAGSTAADIPHGQTRDGAPAQQDNRGQVEASLRTLLEYEHRNSSGERRRYRLVEINPAAVRR